MITVPSELTYSLHGFMKELGILFGIEIDKWFHAASVRLQEERETIYIFIYIFHDFPSLNLYLGF